jgi:hypothetical protein
MKYTGKYRLPVIDSESNEVLSDNSYVDIDKFIISSITGGESIYGFLQKTDDDLNPSPNVAASTSNPVPNSKIFTIGIMHDISYGSLLTTSKGKIYLSSYDNVELAYKELKKQMNLDFSHRFKWVDPTTASGNSGQYCIYISW